jgi:hypothetical protein
MERVRRNPDGVAREKATSGNRLTMKQQEAVGRVKASGADGLTRRVVRWPRLA